MSVQAYSPKTRANFPTAPKPMAKAPNAVKFGTNVDSFFKKARYTDYPDPHTKALIDLENSNRYQITVNEWEKKGSDHIATAVGGAAVTVGMTWLGGWWGEHYNHGPEGGAAGTGGSLLAGYLVKPIVKEFFVPDAVSLKRELEIQSDKSRWTTSANPGACTRIKDRMQNGWIFWPTRQDDFTHFTRGFISDYPVEQQYTREALNSIRGHYFTKFEMSTKMDEDFSRFDPDRYKHTSWSKGLSSPTFERNMFHQAVRSYASNVERDHALLGTCFCESCAVEAAAKHLKKEGPDIISYLWGN